MAVNLQQIGTRLSFFMKLKGLDVYKTAELTETSEKLIHNILAGQNYVMEDLLAVLKNIPTLNPHWLIYGEGNIFRDEHHNTDEHDKAAMLRHRQKHLIEMQKLMEELDRIEKSRHNSSRIDELKARIFEITKEL